MLYLLIAVAICVLVPLLPVWLLRRMPRRPPAPMSEEELHRLASRMRPVDRPAITDDSPRTDITRPLSPAPKSPSRNAAASEEQDETASATDYPPAPTAEKKPVPQLTLPSYRWLQVLSATILIVTFFRLGAGFRLLFDYLGEQRARSIAPGVFLFKPYSYGLVCALPALFLGISCSYPVMTVLFRLLIGRHRFLEWLFWDEGRLGSQNVNRLIRVASVFGFLLSAGCTIFVLLVMNWYARFSDDEIAIKRFIDFGEEVHPYSDVEQIVVSSHTWDDNQIVSGEDLGIRFYDGRKWDTDEIFHMPRDVGERDRLLEFLQWKTGKPIVRVRLLSDAPGW